jgi:hypothetical protein
METDMETDCTSDEARVNTGPHKPNPSFWRRHRHDRLVERWVRVVGPSGSPSSWSTTGTGAG